MPPLKFYIGQLLLFVALGIGVAGKATAPTSPGFDHFLPFLSGVVLFGIPGTWLVGKGLAEDE